MESRGGGSGRAMQVYLVALLLSSMLLVALGSGMALTQTSGAGGASAAALIRYRNASGSFTDGCLPNCKWQCNQPECPAKCDPACLKPKCEHLCEPIGPVNCSIRCEKPECEVRCVRKRCKTGSCPKCENVCLLPACQTVCSPAKPICKPQCPAAKCTWRCSKPRDCPQPKCRLKCERHPTSGSQMAEGGDEKSRGSNQRDTSRCADPDAEEVSLPTRQNQTRGSVSRGSRTKSKMQTPSARAAGRPCCDCADARNLGAALVEASASLPVAAQPVVQQLPSFLEVYHEYQYAQSKGRNHALHCCPCAGAALGGADAISSQEAFVAPQYIKFIPDDRFQQ